MTTKDIRIVVLTQGFVLVGEYAATKTHVTLRNASVIRRWGTDKGLGQIALGGPTNNTVLDACGEAEAPTSAVVMTLKCEVAKWST